jgi:MazG family protein
MADPRVAETFARLIDLMARLRGPQGCPWDREQTPESLRPYLLEEVYEVLEAIESGQAPQLCDELGDLLLQIVFQSQLADEAGRFTIADVARSITDKLVRRHPHVFADVQVRDAREVIRNWGRIKDEERQAKGEVGILSGVPRSLPALVRAQQVDEKVARASGERSDARDVVEHLRLQQAELEAAVAAGDQAATERALGASLFGIARLARHLDLSAEVALRSVTERFVAHVERLESAARERGTTFVQLDPVELAPLRVVPGTGRGD